MKALAHGSVTPAGATVYTAPQSFRCDLKDIMIVNTTAGDLTFTMHFVPSGASATTDNAVFYSTAIPANSTIQWEGNQTLELGGSVYCASSGSGITVRLTGDEYR